VRINGSSPLANNFRATDYIDSKLDTRRWLMKRVIIVGRGASGKSTLARRLSEISRLPLIELDKIFWQPGLVATPREQWIVTQEKLAAEPEWIMDGDLGPHDALEARLPKADTIIFLDFSLVRCVWRAIRRSRERLDFWHWVFSYRRSIVPNSLPQSPNMRQMRTS
jgi:hypothetical protein